jgi:hypothetical protein
LSSSLRVTRMRTSYRCVDGVQGRRAWQRGFRLAAEESPLNACALLLPALCAQRSQRLLGSGDRRDHVGARLRRNGDAEAAV